MIVAGVMTGTSADGVDVALVEVGRQGAWRLLHLYSQPLAPGLRATVLAAASGHAGVAQLAQLHVRLGQALGAAVARACAAAGPAAPRLDLVACHGQTVYHQGGVASLQLGAPAEIAARTGAPVVSDFRAADIAAGGQGAPLAPWLDWRWLRHRRRYRVALNLGGIANITLLPPAVPAANVIGFDTGPGNMLLDALAQRLSHGRLRMDRGGRLALQGRPDPAWLRQLLRHPFLARRPPKSAGREQFGEALWLRTPPPAGLSGPGRMATLVEFTARSVARGLAWGGPEAARAEIVSSGGGTRNPALMAALRRALPHATWRLSDDFGLPSAAKEAVLIALLGAAHLRRQPSNLPRVTGARQAVVLGSYTPPPRRG